MENANSSHAYIMMFPCVLFSACYIISIYMLKRNCFLSTCYGHVETLPLQNVHRGGLAETTSAIVIDGDRLKRDIPT